MPYLNMSHPHIKEMVKALHENLDDALSCLSGMQQPMMSTDQITAEDERKAIDQLQGEMDEAIVLIAEAFYGEGVKIEKPSHGPEYLPDV